MTDPDTPAGSEPPGVPARDLEQALAAMTFHVLDVPYALVALEPPLDAAVLAGLGATAQVIVEPDEITLLLPESALEAITRQRRARAVERDLAWIRFDCPMGWEVVGFLALVSSKLARAGIPIGAVAGYSRDHLFIARRYLDRACAALRELFPEGGGD